MVPYVIMLSPIEQHFGTCYFTVCLFKMCRITWTWI